MLLNADQVAVIDAMGCAVESDPFEFYEFLVPSRLPLEVRERLMSPGGGMVPNPNKKGEMVPFKEVPFYVSGVRSAQRFYRFLNGKTPMRKYFPSPRLIINDFGKNFAFRFGDSVLILDFDPKNGFGGAQLASVVGAVRRVLNATPMMVVTPTGGVHMFVRLPRGYGRRYVNQKMSDRLRRFLSQRMMETSNVELPDSSLLGIDLRMSKDLSAYTVGAGSRTKNGVYTMVYASDNGSALNSFSAFDMWQKTFCPVDVAEFFVEGWVRTVEREEERRKNRPVRTAVKPCVVDVLESSDVSTFGYSYAPVVEDDAEVVDTTQGSVVDTVVEADSDVSVVVEGENESAEDSVESMSAVDRRIALSRQVLPLSRPQTVSVGDVTSDMILGTEACASVSEEFMTENTPTATTSTTSGVRVLGRTEYNSTTRIEPFENNVNDNALIDDENIVLAYNTKPIFRAVQRLREKNPSVSYHEIRFMITAYMASCQDLPTIARVCRVLNVDFDTASGSRIRTNDLRNDILRAWRKLVTTNEYTVDTHGVYCGCGVRSRRNTFASSRAVSGLEKTTLRLLRSYVKWTVLNFDKAYNAIVSATRTGSKVRHDALLITAMLYGFGLSGVVGARLSREYLLEQYGMSFIRRSKAVQLLKKLGVIKLVRQSNQLEKRASMWLVTTDYIDFKASRYLRMMRYNTRVDNSVPAVLQTAVMLDGQGNIMSIFDGECVFTELAPVYESLTSDLLNVAMTTALKVNVTNRDMWERVQAGEARPVTVPLEESVRFSEAMVNGLAGFTRYPLYSVKEQQVGVDYSVLKKNYSMDGSPVFDPAFDYEGFIVQPLEEAYAKARAHKNTHKEQNNNATSSDAHVDVVNLHDAMPTSGVETVALDNDVFVTNDGVTVLDNTTTLENDTHNVCDTVEVEPLVAQRSVYGHSLTSENNNLLTVDNVDNFNSGAVNDRDDNAFTVTDTVSEYATRSVDMTDWFDDDYWSDSGQCVSEDPFVGCSVMNKCSDCVRMEAELFLESLS